MPGVNSGSSSSICTSSPPKLSSLSCVNDVSPPLFSPSISISSSVELGKEITTLEAEIMLLERYLLSLYRTAFENSLSNLSSNGWTNVKCKRESWTPTSTHKSYSKWVPHIQKGGSFHHFQASPASSSFLDNLNSTPSLPQDSTKVPKLVGSGHRSLGDYLGASLVENILDTPDRLSEEIVRCISSIYCKLGKSPQSRASSSISPTSSLSSSSVFSSKVPCDSWSPHCYENATVHHQGLKDDSYLHPTSVEISKIYLEDDSFNYATNMLQKFRSMVQRLEKVDPRTMKREEKLAFWINIHNALLMHAYLAYGTANCLKSASIFKAAYDVGGHCVNAYIIQSSILGIRPHHSAPWLQTLFSSGRKLKAGGVRHVYALEYPEPLVHFALCSGACSDPVVRVYNAKSIFKDLKHAKEEYIRGSIYIKEESKIWASRKVYYYGKEMSLDVWGVLELISECVSEKQQKAIRKCIKRRHKQNKKCIVNWLPQTSTFRYIIHADLAQGR